MKTHILMGIVSFALVSMTVNAAEILDLAKTQANWKKHCISCHGKDGKGKTKAGRKARVTDLTDIKVQEKHTDKQLHDQIKNGFKNKAGKETMKPYAEKLSEAEINDLIAFVRKFKPKK